MTKYEELREKLVASPKTWLITGVAGFIGSNLLEALLKLDQKVKGVDNFSSGYLYNLEEVRLSVSDVQWSRFEFIEGDIRDTEVCEEACKNVEYVLHQAALGSVPRSIKDPITTNSVNIDGFLKMLTASKEARVNAFIYAASSSTYGDHAALPKVEDIIGNPLSPYAVTKYVNELYAGVFSEVYGFESTGLRYFNVFGRRQDPNGAYAAVIPKWIASMIKGEEVYINGDGATSRDFCYIENVVQANLLAAATGDTQRSGHEVFNVAAGGRTTLNELFLIIKEGLNDHMVEYAADPIYREFRAGDVRHSFADIDKARRLLGYEPEFDVVDGMKEALHWYVTKAKGGTMNVLAQ